MVGFCGMSLRQAGVGLTDQERKNIENKLISTCQANYTRYPFERGVCFSISSSPIDVVAVGDINLTICGHPKIDNQTENIGTRLIDLYIAKGLKVFDHLKGDFALALHDKKNEITILAIDRLGIQPLAYTLSADRVVFSSNLDEIISIDNQKPEIDPQAVYHYFYYHMIPSPDSIFKNVLKLQPAEYVVIKKDSIQSQFYWHPQFEEKSIRSIEEYGEELRELIAQSIDNCVDDKGTGAFLSGGIDSSTVSGFLSKKQKNRAKTYSIGFDAEGYDEIQFARITAKAFNLDANEYYVTPDDVFDAVLNIAKKYDEPYGNSSAIPAYYCAKFAQSDGIHTLLAGDGGDELFAGNERYGKQQIFERYLVIPEIIRKIFIEPAVHMIPVASAITPFRKLRSYVDQARVLLPARLESYNFFHRKPLDEILTLDFRSMINTDGPMNLMEQTYRRAQDCTVQNKMLFLDWKQTLADNDLRKVNKMCDLAGINVRYPLLSDELLEFSTKIPSNVKLKGQQLRYFFKKSMEGFLPETILNKPKQGFGLPFGVWLKVSPKLQEMAYDSLTDQKRREYLKPEFIDWLIDKHRNEHAAFYGTLVWVIMMFELWLKQHID